MFLVMICAVMMLITQNITKADENLEHQKNCSTKHVCSIKHQSILPPEDVSETHTSLHSTELQLILRYEFIAY